MKKILLIISLLLFSGCVGLRISTEQYAVTYLRVGPQAIEIEGLFKQKAEPKLSDYFLLSRLGIVQ